MSVVCLLEVQATVLSTVRVVIAQGHKTMESSSFCFCLFTCLSSTSLMSTTRFASLQNYGELSLASEFILDTCATPVKTPDSQKTSSLSPGKMRLSYSSLTNNLTYCLLYAMYFLFATTSCERSTE